MKPTNHLWAIQTEFEKKKYLGWNYKGGKSIYWTSDKKAPAPLLFETKKDALKALERSDRSREKMPKNLFTNVHEGALPGKPVKVKVQVLN